MTAVLLICFVNDHKEKLLGGAQKKEGTKPKVNNLVLKMREKMEKRLQEKKQKEGAKESADWFYEEDLDDGYCF